MPQIKSSVLQKNIGISIYHMIFKNIEIIQPWMKVLIKFVGHLTHSEVRSIYKCRELSFTTHTEILVIFKVAYKVT